MVIYQYVCALWSDVSMKIWLLFFTCKQGCVPQAQRGFLGYDFGVQNSDIVVACKQALRVKNIYPNGLNPTMVEYVKGAIWYDSD
jgi:hypothetical protein